MTHKRKNDMEDDPIDQFPSQASPNLPQDKAQGKVGRLYLDLDSDDSTLSQPSSQPSRKKSKLEPVNDEQPPIQKVSGT